MILDCGEERVPFYQKCGLERKEVQMVRRFTNIMLLQPGSTCFTSMQPGFNKRYVGLASPGLN